MSATFKITARSAHVTCNECGGTMTFPDSAHIIFMVDEFTAEHGGCEVGA